MKKWFDDKKAGMKLLCRFVVQTGVFIILYSILIALPATTIIIFTLEILIYFIAIQIFVERIIGDLWEYLGEKRGSQKLTATLGIIDVIIYSISFCIKEYDLIGLWLSIRVATRLVGFSKIEGESHRQEESVRRNVYLIGQAMTLILGIMFGVFLKLTFNSNFADWVKLILGM